MSCEISKFKLLFNYIWWGLAPYVGVKCIENKPIIPIHDNLWDASAKNIFVRAEWLRQGGCAPSEPSKTPWWRIPPRPASIPLVALHIALRLQFHSFFSLCQSPIEIHTLALWPTVTIRGNRFIGYTLASGFQRNAWRCENLSPCSFHIERQERRKIRRYDTTRLWGSTQCRKERVRPKVGKDRVCIFIVWQDVMKMRCCLSTLGSPEYILCVAHSTSVSAVSPHSHHRSSIVLATGTGNQLLVWVWTTKTGRFGSRPGQNPDQLTLGGPNPDPYPSTHGFRRVRLDLSVPISGSTFRVSHLWSHSDMLLWIVK